MALNERLKKGIKEELVIFISHRSIDRDIADMILDFFIGAGIPREYIFCSSLPGNDINEKISAEVKNKLKNSVLNIAILSNDYYKSAYCLNESGVMWFCDEVPVIPVALPEITLENMYGFLNSEYKIRRLNSLSDISYMYDTACTAVSVKQYKVGIIHAEASKLKDRYEGYTSKRPLLTSSKKIDGFNISSNDEAVVLYYILAKKVRKIKKDDIVAWMIQEEIYDVDVENGFDLLSTYGNGKYEKDILEFDIEMFRQYSKISEDLMLRLNTYVEKQKKNSLDIFSTMWKTESFDAASKLFILYIIDRQMTTFGDRWLADGQIIDIKDWEVKNNLDNTLSINYSSCLSTFIDNDLVHASEWTSHGNPREYSLNTSLKNYLFQQDFPYLHEILEIKRLHTMKLPF